MSMDCAASDAVVERIGKTLGLLQRPEWDDELPKALGALAYARGCSVEDLTHRIAVDDALVAELAGQLTVGESYFLRHPEHFDELVRWVDERTFLGEDPLHLRVWSAGCAGGEEAYSVAITAHRARGSELLSRLTVYATDLSAPSIERAHQACYSPWSFRGAPAWLLAQYFEVCGKRCVLRPTMQRAVRFECGSIEQCGSRLAARSMDVIFFRNVGIYLDAETNARIYETFRRVLRDDGTLFIGYSDPRPARELFVLRHSDQTTVYRHATEVDTQPSKLRHMPRAPGAERKRPSVKRLRRAQGGSSPTESQHAGGGESKGSVRHVSLTDAAGLPQGAADHREDEGDLAARAQRVADRGDLAQARRIVAALIHRNEVSSTGFLIRGKITLLEDRPKDAVIDLRRAVFLAPESAAARYWLAMGLLAANNPAAARRQLIEVRRLLDTTSPEQLIDDSETTASELLTAVETLERLLPC